MLDLSVSPTLGQSNETGKASHGGAEEQRSDEFSMRLEWTAAFDLLEKWFEEKSLLHCEGNFRQFVFPFQAMVFDLNRGEIRFLSDDAYLEFVFKLSDSLSFNYADARILAGQEGISYERCLLASYGSVPGQGPHRHAGVCRIKNFELVVLF